MAEVYLLLGSNIGDSIQYLRDAEVRLSALIGRIIRRSSFYRTQSWGKTDQPDFINRVISIETAFSAREVLKKILETETAMGRVRYEKWGSRIIDIDILFFGNLVINSADLIVPHPQLQNRRFTLEPLNEIAPDFAHPRLNVPVKTLLDHLTDHLSVVRIDP